MPAYKWLSLVLSACIDTSAIQVHAGKLSKMKFFGVSIIAATPQESITGVVNTPMHTDAISKFVETLTRTLVPL